MTIRAIETRYKGYRFRSRLEARWAVFFDALGLAWEYEPQGFVIESGMEPPRSWNYLPDFRLPGLDTWIEVKGSLDDLSDDYFDMIGHAVDWGGQLPGVGNSLGTTRGLLWLGPIPRDDGVGYPSHIILQHSKGGYFSDCTFDSTTGLRVNGAGGDYFDATWPAGKDIRRVLKEHVYASHGWWLQKRPPDFRLRRAYCAARSARFEHGENPS